jgi:HEPN domain-containing protein
MQPAEPWKIYLAKAAQDELAVDRLAPLQESSDEIVGFHLQQAAEKMLKALLVFRNIEFRRTHNLGELIHLLEKHGEIFLPELDTIRDLTPYAVEWRYDFIEPEGQTRLERMVLKKQIVLLRQWVEARIKKGI